jgi:hypothetical protein
MTGPQMEDYLEHFRARMLQDALSEAAAVYWPGSARGVVGFEELVLGAYVPLLIAAMGSVLLSVLSSAMDPSDR